MIVYALGLALLSAICRPSGGAGRRDRRVVPLREDTLLVPILTVRLPDDDELAAVRADDDHATPAVTGWRRTAAALAAVAPLLLAACSTDARAGNGGNDESAARHAEPRLIAARSGTITFALAAQAEGTQPVGFQVEGTYAFDDEQRYPRLDMTFQRFPSTAAASRVVSTGDAVFAGAGEDLTAVPAERAQILRSLQRGGDFLNFGFASWLVDPVTQTSGAETVTTGAVDVPVFLADLARSATQIGGTGEIRAPDKETADRLRALVASSAMTVVTDAKTGAFRSLEVEIDFTADASDALRAVLGPYAGVRLEVALTYAPLTGPFEPDVPIS